MKHFHQHKLQLLFNATVSETLKKKKNHQATKKMLIVATVVRNG